MNRRKAKKKKTTLDIHSRLEVGRSSYSPGGEQLRFAVHRPGSPVAPSRSHGVPRRDVPGRVHVSVERVSAGSAGEDGLALARLRIHSPARRASLARVRGINTFDPTGCLVLKSPYQDPPRGTQDAAVEGGLRLDIPPGAVDGAFGGAGHVPNIIANTGRGSGVCFRQRGWISTSHILMPIDFTPTDGDGADIDAMPHDVEVTARQDGVEPGLTDGPGLRASLEAILLVADEPVSEVVLAQVLERPRDEVAEGLRTLAAEYTADGRGFDLREIAGGWRFYTREDCAPLVERFVRDGQEVRLTQAALETLAVIAYRQPVSRARVSAVRGVNCDGVIRTLVLRGLVEDSGTDPESGAILYRTTGYFLERLGMASLDELPDLAPFLPENIEDIEDNERTRT